MVELSASFNSSGSYWKGTGEVPSLSQPKTFIDKSVLGQFSLTGCTKMAEEP
jgi:hypothetical protein